jgi:hypothetical protein
MAEIADICHTVKQTSPRACITRATALVMRGRVCYVSAMRTPTYLKAERRSYGFARSGPAVTGATDFLRGNATMASLMPTVMRLAALQKDCAKALPAMFEHCDILQFESGQLVLAIPNAALAAKLKQQLPKLQAELERKGWQISGIRLKVQVIKSIAPIVHTRALVLPEKAMSALEELSTALPASKQNEQLIAALRSLVRHHREPKD